MAGTSADSSAWWTALPSSFATLAAIDRLARVLPNLERDPRFRRGAVELSLERTRALVAALRDPLRGVPVIHVAGSKGKGTVCLLASALLRAHGRKVGTYLSPHVDRWTERIQVDGRPLTAAAMGCALAVVLAAARRQKLGAPTLFEALTVAAFVAFRAERVEVAVIEVGIGGLRDATNVVASDVAVVTSIELEHVAVLGRSLAAIAAQKAGIFKRGALALSGVPAARPEAAMIRASARRVHAPLIEWGRGLAVRARGGAFSIAAPTLGLRLREVPAPAGGSFARRNAALALAAVAGLARRRTEMGLTLRPDRVAAALATVALPGRLEVVAERPRTWRDGAHTPRSLRAVVRDVAAAAGRPPVVLFALKRDKPLAACLAALRGACGPLVATSIPDGLRTVVPTGSCFDPKEIVATARSLGIMARPVERPAAALALARRLAGAKGALLVTGSFWLAGVVPRLLRRTADRR